MRAWVHAEGFIAAWPVVFFIETHVRDWSWAGGVLCWPVGAFACGCTTNAHRNGMEIHSTGLHCTVSLHPASSTSPKRLTAVNPAGFGHVCLDAAAGSRHLLDPTVRVLGQQLHHAGASACGSKTSHALAATAAGPMARCLQPPGSHCSSAAHPAALIWVCAMHGLREVGASISVWEVKSAGREIRRLPKMSG